MFPYDDELDEDLENEDEQGDDTPVEFGVLSTWDNMNGARVDGSKALAIWARNALLTPRGRYEIFTEDYGSDLEDLIGVSSDAEYLAAEAERMVEECVTMHEGITGIDNFTSTFDDGTLAITFTLVTDYGEEELDVVI